MIGIQTHCLVMLATLSIGVALAADGGRSAAVNFVLHCSGCHGIDGSGYESAGVPNFRNSIEFFAIDEEGRTYLLHVPGLVNTNLSDTEIAEVLNYVVKQWSGTSTAGMFIRFTPAEVAERRARSVSDVVRLRRQIASRLRQEGLRTANYPWP